MLFFEKFTYWLWGVPMTALFLTAGAVFTFKSRFFQLRRLGTIVKSPFSKDKNTAQGQMSSFQAACLAIGGSVGVANISGVATAVVTGGAGAVFWMWAAAFFGMIIKMAEVTLASFYRRRDAAGKTWGGPTYYMQSFLGGEKKRKRWCVPAVLFGGGIFASLFLNVQNYAVSEAVSSTFGLPQLIPSLLLAAATYILISGGLRFLGRISGWLVPLMCLFYMGCVAVVLCKNAENILPSLRLILSEAFSLRPVAGGVAGTCMARGIKVGFARAVYSNEAGWGTSPMVHATAEVSHPVRQGILGAFEVFADTMLVCTATGLLVICTGAYQSGLSGAALALSAIESNLGGFARVAVAVSVFLFGLSSAVGWYAYYVTLIHHAFPSEKTRTRLLNAVTFLAPALGVVLTAAVGLLGEGSELIWTIADFSAVVPTFINLSVLLCMSGRFGELVRDYERKK